MKYNFIDSLNSKSQTRNQLTMWMRSPLAANAETSFWSFASNDLAEERNKKMGILIHTAANTAAIENIHVDVLYWRTESTIMT